MHTRQDIDSIQIGTLLAFCLDGDTCSKPRKVVEIFARACDVHGKLFVCGYTEFGPTSRISFSLKEGDPSECDARGFYYRLAGIEGAL